MYGEAEINAKQTTKRTLNVVSSTLLVSRQWMDRSVLPMGNDGNFSKVSTKIEISQFGSGSANAHHHHLHHQSQETPTSIKAKRNASQ